MDKYSIVHEGIEYVYNRMRDCANGYDGIKSSLRSVLANVKMGDHDSKSASLIEDALESIDINSERLNELNHVTKKAGELFSSSQEYLMTKVNLTDFYLQNYELLKEHNINYSDLSKMSNAGIGALNSLLLPEELRNKYEQYIGYSSSTAFLFSGYGNTGVSFSNKDIVKTTFYKSFDVAKAQIKGFFTGEDAEYNYMRSALEEVLESYDHSNDSLIYDIISGIDEDLMKDLRKMVKSGKTWMEAADELGLSAQFKEINELVKDDSFIQAYIYLDDTYDVLKKLKIDIGKIDLGGSDIDITAVDLSSIIKPLLKDYSDQIQALESMRNSPAFGDSELLNRVIDDMIYDYSHSYGMALEELGNFLTTSSTEELEKLLLAKDPVTGTVKLVELSIDALGVATGNDKYTTNILEYGNYLEIQNSAQKEFQMAAKIIESGNFTSDDVTRFENSFDMARAASLTLCKKEKELIDKQISTAMSDSKHFYEIDELLNQQQVLEAQIDQLNNMKRDDPSTWFFSDGSERVSFK